MGNRSSRRGTGLRRAARETPGAGGARRDSDDTRDMERLAHLLMLRQELEQRQDALRTSLDRRTAEMGVAEAETADGDTDAGEQDGAAEEGGRLRRGEGETDSSRSILRRFLQHHLILGD